MKCPIDSTDLLMTDRNGIEIDYCPQCRGVWLDRGELDKIIDKSVQPNAPAHREQYEERSRREEPRYDDRHKQGHGHKKHKKENFLSDLFDF